MNKCLLALIIAALACTSMVAETRNGFIVQLGCDNPAELAKLAKDGCVVQGLDTDAKTVAKAREYIKDQGLYGQVSVQQFDGKALPYVDNLVNQIVVTQDTKHVTREEMERVLAPRGVTVQRAPKTGDQVTFRKAVPAELDDWTHFLHDTKGSSVSLDKLAGHPNGLKWTGGPFWARSHEHTASMTAMVSTAGRIFYVMDEGRVDSIQLPAKIMLVARDAFSGVILWKHPLKDWWNALYPLKSGPIWLARRLVAIDDRVYIAPGIGQDLICLDAATGKKITTYNNTASVYELIVSDGVILAAIDSDRIPNDYNQQNADCWKERDRASKLYQWTPQTGTRILKAINADSGKVLWEKETPITPMSLVADSEKVCFHDGTSLIALNRKSGDELWKTQVAELKEVKTGYGGPRVVMCKDRIVVSPLGYMYALSSKTGELLWSVRQKPRSGHFSMEDFYVIDDMIWVMNNNNNGKFSVYSLETGEELEDINNPLNSFYIHQRCYPGRATVNYLLPPIMGLQIYDMKKNKWFNNHWIRGGCTYGLMPANGMIYTPPHACACYYQSKMNGFNAVSPIPAPSEAPAPEKRLVKGPAYGKTTDYGPQTTEDWSCFRQNNERTGYVKTDVPAKVKEAWTADFSGKISQATVSDGSLYVSEVDAHTVHAVDAKSGKKLWSFTANGRVDSPPTIYKGVAYFGSADGFVYAVTADKGKLAWKFQAAPTERKIISFNQPESVWPVSGSVLIQNNKLYCIAGRTMFLDGGLRMIILNPDTGELITENVMGRKAPGTDKDIDAMVQGKHMPVAMPDILSSDGKNVFMKSQVFDLNGKRTRIEPQRPDTQYGEEVHLFAPTSFLDDSWHQRTYWIYGRAAGEGWAEFQYPPKVVPCGRILCIDEKNAYSYGRDPELMCNTSVSEYRLFSALKIPSREEEIANLEGKWAPVKSTRKGRKAAKPPRLKLARNSCNWHRMSQKKPEELSALDYNWINEEPDVMAKAMVLANDHLFVAGPRDVADEKILWGKSNEEGFKAQMNEQNSWLEGKKGGIIQVFSKKDGMKINEMAIEKLPAFDGLVAAHGQLYLSTVDGSIVCYK